MAPVLDRSKLPLYRQAIDAAAAEGYALIRVPNLPALQEKVAGYNRRAERLGVPQRMDLKVGDEVAVFHPAVIEHYLAAGGAIGQRIRLPERVEVYQKVILNGEPPAINGWAVRARIEAVPGAGCFIQNIDHQFQVPKDYQDRAAASANPECDHCKQNRARKEAYIVQNVESREVIQVGSSCVKDFSGHPDAMALLALAMSRPQPDDEDPEGGWRSGQPSVAEADVFLAAVHAYIRLKGWVSRKRASDDAAGARASADLAWVRISHPSKQVYEAMKEDGYWVDILPEDRAAAEEVRAAVYARLQAQRDSQQGLNDYEHNLYLALGKNVVPESMSGVVASVFAVEEHYKSKQQAALEALERAKKAVNLPLGERLDMEVEFQMSRPLGESNWGMRYLNKFFAPKENAYIVWFSGQQVEPFDGVKLVRFSVKENKVFREVPENLVSRLQFRDLNAEAAAADAKAKQAAALKAEAKARGIKVSELKKRIYAAESFGHMGVLYMVDPPINIEEERREAYGKHLDSAHGHLKDASGNMPYPHPADSCDECKRLLAWNEGSWFERRKAEVREAILSGAIPLRKEQPESSSEVQA